MVVINGTHWIEVTLTQGTKTLFPRALVKTLFGQVQTLFSRNGDFVVKRLQFFKKTYSRYLKTHFFILKIFEYLSYYWFIIFLHYPSWTFWFGNTTIFLELLIYLIQSFLRTIRTQNGFCFNTMLKNSYFIFTKVNVI